MELLPWIDPDKLYYKALNRNVNAIHFLKQHPECIHFSYFIGNKLYKPVLEDYLFNSDIRSQLYFNEHSNIEHFIRIIDYNYNDWELICSHPSCIDLMIENPKKYRYDWEIISKNPKAVPFLIKNFDRIKWSHLCLNQSKEAIELVIQYPDKIDWLTLSSNSFAIDYLRQHRDKIDRGGICWNENAIDIIEELMNLRDNYILYTFNWMGLSQNKNAIHILEQHQEKIVWAQFSENPSIFCYPYQKLALERSNLLREDLMKKTLHPSKIQYWLENGLDIEDLPE